jgi:hypothetical protein
MGWVRLGVELLSCYPVVTFAAKCGNSNSWFGINFSIRLGEHGHKYSR